MLERISLARYYRAIGFSSVQAYAAHRGVEPSERKARELCALEARLEGLPEIRAAYLAGEFEWTKVRDAAPAVTPETEHVWLARLRDGWTNRQLETQARLDRGLPPIRRLLHTVTPAEPALPLRSGVGALYDQLVADVVRSAGRALEDEEIFEALVLRALHGVEDSESERETDSTVDPGTAVRESEIGVSEAGVSEHSEEKAGGKKRKRRAPTRIVIDRCPDCRRTTIEGRDGPVEVSEALYEHAGCDSETLDIREGPDRVTRTIPPMTANYVLGRDHHRCQVKGCRNMAFVDLHHEGGRAIVGHDPDALITLCTEHHLARHRGHFRIEGRGRDRRFLLPDGTEIGARPRPLMVSDVPHVGSSTAVPHVGSSTTVPHVGSTKQDHRPPRRD